jgi:hypothetical protein
VFRTSRTTRRAAHEQLARHPGQAHAAHGPQPGPASAPGGAEGGLDGIGSGGGAADRPGPRRASRRDRRQLRLWYSSADFPLFGLPADWTGRRLPGQRAGRQAIRRTGPFGLLTRPGGPLWIAALGLTHIAPDGGCLHVATHRVTSYQTLEAMAAVNFFRRLALPLLQQGDREGFDSAVIALRARYRSGQLEWRRAVIPVGTDAMYFRALTIGTDWVALAEITDICLQLDAQRFPIGGVRLVRITDPGPYLSPR